MKSDRSCYMGSGCECGIFRFGTANPDPGLERCGLGSFPRHATAGRAF